LSDERLKTVALFILLYFQYERLMEKEKAAEATKSVDAEWKELQMLMSAVKVCALPDYL